MTDRTQIYTDTYLRPELLGYVKFAQVQCGEWHSHPFSEAVYISSGTFIAETECKTLVLNRDSAVIIPPDVRHRFSSLSDDSHMLYVGCSYMYRGTRLPPFEGSAFEIIEPKLLAPLRISAEKCKETTSEGLSLIGNSIFADLMPLWYHFMPSTNISRNGNATVRKIEEYLNDHISEKILISDIAKAFYLSANALNNQFRTANGVCIKEYLNRLRMSRAMTLLKETDLPVSEISEQLGFDTPQYFSSCFHNYYGFSPRFAKKADRYINRGTEHEICLKES